MGNVVKQKLVKIDLLNPYPEVTAYHLTNTASEGYCYGGHATQMSVAGGAIYILWTLKQERLITEEGVPCPVIGCNFVAPKMSADGTNLNSKKEERSNYLCPIHRIYISPSTFEYEEPTTSILWPEDKETVLILSKSGKRTWSRMGRGL